MTTATSAPAGRQSLTRSSISSVRRARNTLATCLIYLALAFALVPLAFVLYYVVSKGIGVIDGAFLTEELRPGSRTP